jgi:chitinase
MSIEQVPLFSRLTRLKRSHPALRVWISIGGWSMNNPDQPTHTAFSALAASQGAQEKFITSLLSFMQTYGFDGVDFDWMYPAVQDRGGAAADSKNFAIFLKRLRQTFDASGHTYGLSVALPSQYSYLKNFDIVAMSQTVDWFNLRAFDLHGKWTGMGHTGDDFISAHSNLSEIDSTLQLFWLNNILPEKVVLGIGFYGRSRFVSKLRKFQALTTHSIHPD